MSIVREFSRMLSSIPHDQAFTQLLLSQIVTYYDKCCGWYKSKDSQNSSIALFINLSKAIVTKVSPRGRGGVQLKAAAGFAESGPIHDLVVELWQGSDPNRQEVVDKVHNLLIFSYL